MFCIWFLVCLTVCPVWLFVLFYCVLYMVFGLSNCVSCMVVCSVLLCFVYGFWFV